ncbi:MAG: alpha/beta hydrolase [Crocinitomicaceae bacterium]|nr:alpha/beta hydrolase [Crocinitomicaceae bacterium]
MKFILMFTTLATLLSCNSYRLVERHIDKKMNGANLSIKTEVISGDTIEYWDNNADKPVAMLIHGFGASTKYQWYDQVKMLSQDYRVIAPNLFHFGNSRPGIEKFEIRDQMELVNALVNHLGIEKMNLFGVSYGGLVSMEYAHNYESKISKLVVFDAPVKYMYERDIDTICKRFDVKSVEDLFVPTNAKELKKLLYLAMGKKSPVPNFMLKAFYDNVYSQNHENKRRLMTTLIAGLEEYAAHNYDFNSPTLLIWGDTDMIVPVERAPLIRRHIGSNAELHIIKNGAHMPNLTKTKEFNRLVTEFLSKP